MKKDNNSHVLKCEETKESHDNIMELRPWELECSDVVSTHTVFTSATHKVRMYACMYQK